MCFLWFGHKWEENTRFSRIVVTNDSFNNQISKGAVTTVLLHCFKCGKFKAQEFDGNFVTNPVDEGLE